jgi:hypothetical protein
MRQSSTAVTILLALALPPVHGCGSGSQGSRSNGSGGGAIGASGGAGIGGTTGTGGANATGGITETGGANATGGTTETGGTRGTGGVTGTGGTAVTTMGGGGAMASGGATGTGGATASTGSGGTTQSGGSTGAGGAGVDAGGTACSCAQGTTSWDCYCSAYDCTRTLDYYRPDGGTGPWVIATEEYADCNLAVITTRMGSDFPLRHVFDLTTGRLVGDETGTDYPTKCPFGPDGGSFNKLGAGILRPDSTCVRSKCTGGSSLTGTVCSDAGT